MIVTRLKKVPWSWVWMSQLPFAFWMITEVLQHTAFALTLRKFVSNPAIITTILASSRIPLLIVAPLVNYLSDHIWTRWGRRKPFYVLSNGFGALFLALMPLAPNIVVITILLWLFQFANALGKTFFPLSQEVIPIPQRGRGSAIHSAMFQIGLVVYYGFILGRFDDIYFVGPLMSLGAISGETFTYWFAALLMLLPLLIVAYGIKELPIPDMLNWRTVAATGAGRPSIWRFLGKFVRDVFDRQWAILYLLLFGSAVFGMSLGPITAFLYTEQWGYSLQDMGTNIMLGVLIMLPFIALSGWLADRFSKMTVYLSTIAVAMALNIAYYLFVRYVLPDQRPTLWQILLFGELISICGWIVNTVSWPLIYEYVPRKRMGTANAGMEMVYALLGVVLAPLVGWWVAGYSSMFLPHAGLSAHIVAQAPLSTEVVEAVVRNARPAGGDYDNLDVRPFLYPGRDPDQSSQYTVTLPDETAGVHFRNIARLEAEQAQLRQRLEGIDRAEARGKAGFAREFEKFFESGPTDRPEVASRLAVVEAELADEQRLLQEQVDAFHAALALGLVGKLVPAGGEIERAERIECVDVRYPVAGFPMKPLMVALERTLLKRHPELVRLGVETRPSGAAEISLVLVPAPGGTPLDLRAELEVLQGNPGLFESDRPPRGWFGSLVERMGLSADLSSSELAGRAGELARAIEWDGKSRTTLQGFRMQVSTTNTIADVDARRLGEALTVPGERLVEVEPAPGEARLTLVAAYLRSAIVAGGAGVVESLPNAVRERLASVAGDGLPLPVLARTYEDLATATDAVRTALRRPVVGVRYAPQRYDYFSAYLLLILAAAVAIGVTVLVITMERKGWVRRLGVQEEKRAGGEA